MSTTATTALVTTNGTGSAPDILRLFQLTAFAKGGTGAGSQGNNKFYRVKAWKTGGGLYRFRAEYGKVGQEANPSSTEKQNVTLAFIESKIAEKIRHGYKEVELHSAPVTPAASPVNAIVKAADPKVEALVAWMFQEAGEAIARYLRVKVEALSQSQIAAGRSQLMIIQGLWGQVRQSPTTALRERLANEVLGYFNTIPTLLPRRIDREQVVQDFCNDLGEQENRLDQLEAAIAAAAVQAQGGTQVQALGCDIQVLPTSDPRYDQIRRYVGQRANHGYTCRVRDIFIVHNPLVADRYEASTRGKGNVRTLTHGSHNKNWRHILHGGLRQPQQHSNGVANGSNFGRGIYFADTPTKSANYCAANGWGTTVAGGQQFGLVLCDVALGQMYTPRSTDGSLGLSHPAMRGYESVFAKGALQNNGANSGVQYNEYVIFDEAQHKPRFFVTWERA